MSHTLRNRYQFFAYFLVIGRWHNPPSPSPCLDSVVVTYGMRGGGGAAGNGNSGHGSRSHQNQSKRPALQSAVPGRGGYEASLKDGQETFEDIPRLGGAQNKPPPGGVGVVALCTVTTVARTQ